MTLKRGRPAGTARLTRERILTAALALVDAHGVAALSMRQLATTLGVDPMAIYHHLPNKQAVLSGVVALAFEELALPALPASSWQTEVRAFAAAYSHVLRAHRHLLLLLVSDLELGAQAILQANEYLYAALARASLAPAHLATAADTVIDYLHGVALAAGLQGTVPGAPQSLAALLGRFPAADVPVQRRVLAALADQSPPAGDAGLELILLGISALGRDD